jgi:peptidyl-prolyl cis-trans isomerase B (cyclophilin B)
MLTGCSNQKITDEQATDSAYDHKSQEQKQKQENKNLGQSKRETTEEKEITNNQEKNMTSPDQSQFKDLAKEYSQAIIKTNQGDITVKFYGEDSPKTVNNFLNLAQLSFYDGTKFHRVIKDFMVQGGDPNSKSADWSTHGTGGPDYRFADEFNSHKLVTGSLAMANAGPNTNGSQFFIVTAPETAWLDGRHTNFGQVIAGMDIVKKIEAAETDSNDHPLEDITIEKIELVK